MSDQPSIGLIGVGAMGSRMARRLAEHDVRLTLYDSEPMAIAALSSYASVTVAGRLIDLADCQALITMLPNAEVVRSVLLDGAPPLAPSLAPGTVIIDMSSSAPTATVALAAELDEYHLRLIDAPVSGGIHSAAAGTLTIMAGGDASMIDEWAWLFAMLGRGHVHTGQIGSGHALKALNNLLSAGGLLLAVEALAVGKQFGLSPTVMLAVINQSSGANNSTQNKMAQRVLSRTFDAGFTIGLMTKDLVTALELAQDVNLDVPLSTRTVELWQQALAALGPAVDHTAIARWFEHEQQLTIDDESDAVAGQPSTLERY